MVEVRAEGAGDEAQIRAVHLAAFPTPLEADLVDQLKAEGDAVISLVAEDAAEIIGHVLFSRMRVVADERPVEALALAPVAVVPERQSEGIGSKLIKAGLSEAEARKTEIVFLVGEPEYYRRFGFDSRAAEPFESPYAGPYFQAKLLRRDHRPPAHGRADYAPAFAGLE